MTTINTFAIMQDVNDRQALKDQAHAAKQAAKVARWRANDDAKRAPHRVVTAEIRVELAQIEAERLAAILAHEKQAERARNAHEMTTGRIAVAQEIIATRIESLRRVLHELQDVSDQLNARIHAEVSTRVLLESLRVAEVNLSAAVERMAGEMGLEAVSV
jgi:hypothetical protein